MKYYRISCCADYMFPMEIVYGHIIDTANNLCSFPYDFPCQNEWGKSSARKSRLIIDSYPKLLNIKWISLTEYKIYSAEILLNVERFDEIWKALSKDLDNVFERELIFGLGLEGKIVIWLSSPLKTLIVDTLKVKEDTNLVNVVEYNHLKGRCDNVLISYCNNINKNISLKTYNLRPVQYNYRYVISFGTFNDYRRDNEDIITKFNYIDEMLSDGTCDKQHSNNLLNYHYAGKPLKIVLNWHIKKSEYTANFWFDEEKTCLIFERFYGAHPDTKTDFIIRIDAEKKKYELALFRQGLKEPQIIPEDAYQLLVFKNKFENYRSENYNQERGAWIW